MSEAQSNAIHIHHRAAAIDTALGDLHDRTVTRKEILDFVNQLNLRNVTLRDMPNVESIPIQEKAVEPVESYLDQYSERAEAIPDGEVFIRQGEELR